MTHVGGNSKIPLDEYLHPLSPKTDCAMWKIFRISQIFDHEYETGDALGPVTERPYCNGSADVVYMTKLGQILSLRTMKRSSGMA